MLVDSGVYLLFDILEGRNPECLHHLQGGPLRTPINGRTSMGNWGYFSSKSEDLVSIYKPLQHPQLPSFRFVILRETQPSTKICLRQIDRLNKFQPFLQIDEEYHGRTERHQLQKCLQKTNLQNIKLCTAHAVFTTFSRNIREACW